MTPRRTRAALSGAIAGSLFAGGCTLLVSFDEVPVEDAGITGPAARPPDVTVVDAGDLDAPATPDADVPADAAPDFTRACAAKPDGKYCNGNQIVVDGGSKDDLVTCLNEKTVSVKRCTTGLGCVRMPSGYPDECDSCQGKANGLYCGDDFAGWHPMNARARIRCDNDAIVGNILCATACVGTGPTASCQ